MVRFDGGVRYVRKGSIRGSMCFAGFLAYFPVLSVFFTHILRKCVSAAIRSENFPLPSHPGQQRESGIAAANLDGSLVSRIVRSVGAAFFYANKTPTRLPR